VLTFMPGPDNLIYAGRDTWLLDTATSSAIYKLSAVDIHGNESRFAIATVKGSTTSVALPVSVTATPTRVVLGWYAMGLPSTGMTLYRRRGGGLWASLGALATDNQGMLTYQDGDVVPGETLSYRLGMMDGDQEVFSDEIGVTVPLARVAMLGIQPNPIV